MNVGPSASPAQLTPPPPIRSTKTPPFATLEPSPRFEHVIRASGGHGEAVREPKELMPALERALKVVKEEKRQALVNVCLEASYVKTS